MSKDSSGTDSLWSFNTGNFSLTHLEIAKVQKSPQSKNCSVLHSSYFLSVCFCMPGYQENIPLMEEFKLDFMVVAWGQGKALESVLSASL